MKKEGRMVSSKEADTLREMLTHQDPRMTKRHKHGACLLLKEYNQKKTNRKKNKQAKKSRRRNRK